MLISDKKSKKKCDWMQHFEASIKCSGERMKPVIAAVSGEIAVSWPDPTAFLTWLFHKLLDHP